jgi:hypothetical protein
LPLISYLKVIRRGVALAHPDHFSTGRRGCARAANALAAAYTKIIAYCQPGIWQTLLNYSSDFFKEVVRSQQHNQIVLLLLQYVSKVQTMAFFVQA